MHYKVVMRCQLFPYSCLHSELVSCVGWTNPEEVYSAGDDHQILRWNLLTNESSLVVKLNDDVYPTDMQWFPKAGASKKGNASDVFALSSTDGQLHFGYCLLYFIHYKTLSCTTGRYIDQVFL